MNQKDDSSNSSIDDDAYLDEQEDPMTDQQSQNNQNLAGAVAGNTLPVKTSGNATRSVIDIIDGVAWSESLFNFIGLSDESQWVKFILISHRETSIFIFLWDFLCFLNDYLLYIDVLCLRLIVLWFYGMHFSISFAFIFCLVVALNIFKLLKMFRFICTSRYDLFAQKNCTKL